MEDNCWHDDADCRCKDRAFALMETADLLDRLAFALTRLDIDRQFDADAAAAARWLDEVLR